MEYFRSLLLLSALFAGIVAEYAPIRQTKAGQVRGYIREFNGKQIYLYEGIRYGRAERFEAPVAEKPWEGVYNATRYRFACPQPGISYADKLDDGRGVEVRVANEDCLFMNVFMPADNKTGRAVMFWIHGGTFISGTIFNQMYDGRVLVLEGDVIVVSVNYRLGPFGFMYGGGGKYPGNQGLMDQVLALKWVQDNIEAFGGDPTKVTIFGESAGAMSSGNLILSPEAKGLFARAILQSGSPNSYLGSEYHRKSEKKTAVLAEGFNCDNSSLVAMTECLKNKTVRQLLDATANAVENGESYVPVWGTAFLPHNPWDALKKGHFNPVDVLQGINRDEGSIFVVGLFPNLAPEAETPLNKSTTKTFVRVLMSTFFPGRDIISKEIGEYYSEKYDKLNNTDKYKMAISGAFGDFHLTCPSMLFVQLLGMKRREGNYYAYHLDKQSSLPLLNCRKWMGVCHAQDIIFMFGFPQRFRGLLLDDDEYNLSVDMVKSWTTFARNGQPGTVGNNVSWTPAIPNHGSDESASLMNLNPRDYRMMPHFYRHLCNDFWQSKFPQ